jgi:hypothetical protein
MQPCRAGDRPRKASRETKILAPYVFGIDEQAGAFEVFLLDRRLPALGAVEPGAT